MSVSCILCDCLHVDVELRPCKHAMCVNCATVQLKECTLCSKNIIWIAALEDNGAVVAKLAQIYKESELLYTSIQSLIRGSDIRKCATLILQVAEDGYLSVAQTESLLISARDKSLLNHDMQNTLVKLCNQPWLVNKDLGGCGICYFGNLGQIPLIHEAIKILAYNFKQRCKIDV